MAKELPTITIEQYAGIKAALADGFPLEQVLEQEGVPDWRWSDLDLEMTDAMTSDPDAFVAYSAKLAEAEEHLRRKIEPLDSDLAAWTGFVVAYNQVGDALLEAHALRPSDVGRLQRHWQARFGQDDDLRKRAEKLAKDPPAPPDAVQAEQAALRPFPWTPGADEAEEARSLEPLAFLAGTENARRKPGVTLPFAGVSPLPAGNLALEPSPEMGMTAVAASRPGGAATPFEPQPIAPPATKPAVASPATKPAVASPAPKLLPTPPTPVSPLEPAPWLAATAPASDAPLTPALPFAGEAEAPAKIAASLEPLASLGMTAPTRKGKPVTTRFAKVRTPCEPPRPSDVKISTLEPNPELATTTEVKPKAQAADAPALPFRGENAPPTSALSSLEPVAGLGMTAPVSDARSQPLPFDSAEPPPSDTSAGWTPEDYGRYCAELDAYVAERPKVFARWHVRDDAHHEAIAQHWVERFQADPSLRQRFADALCAAAEQLRR